MNYYSRSGKKIIRIISGWFVWICLFYPIDCVAQSCPPAFVQNICPTSSASVGTQTILGATYTWLKDGKTKKGPLPGDGGAISLDFVINGVEDAGFYTIEQTLNGITTCVTNIQVVLVPLPLPQILTEAGSLCNGEKVLSLSNSEEGVTYELMSDGIFVEAVNRSTSGSFNFSPIFYGGIYSVKAYKNACSNFSNSYIEFGNIRVTDIPDPAVINYSTTNTASVSWPGSGSFILEYGPSGFSPGTGASPGPGGILINSSASPVVLTGLSTGTTYDIYIRQLCAPGIYSYSNKTTLVTDCDPVASFPYTQGFESVLTPALPSCWYYLYNRNNGYNSFFTNTGYARTGNQYLYAGSNWVILPKMILTGNQRLKYFVRPSSGQAAYQIRLSTGNNAQGSFSTVLYSETISSPNYSEKTIDLSSFAGPVYLEIQHLSGYLRFDDFIIENIPPCPGPAFVKINSISSASATVSWTGTGSFIIEYGAMGFTPGTGNSAGAGGTVISTASSQVVINGLLPNTFYDVYVRQNCSSGGNGYSINAPKTNFSTFLNCVSATSITACTNINAVSSSGTGIVDFNGVYPNNSTGISTPGKELLYSFTPPATGVYYLDVLSSTGAPASYLYKKASSGCSDTGWTGIYSGFTNPTGKYPIGMLQSGVPYLLLIDGENDYAGIAQVFKICKANVGASANCNNTYTINRPIPPFSSKKEYLLDNTGNLLAELDFSNVGNAVGNITASYYTNSGGAVPRDLDNKEFMNRDFTISSATIPSGPVGIKLYFTNTDLQQLINEPNDGIADINNIGDLGISRTTAKNCFSGKIGFGEFLAQTGNGAYDAASSYIQFTINAFGTLYLHGGAVTLSPDAYIACPNANVNFQMVSLGASATYQWQVDNGSGFINLSNINNYSGVQTSILSISSPTSPLYGYKYRCVANNGGNTLISHSNVIKFSQTWNGNFDTDWMNPKNWNCSSYPDYHIPDASTDVIIPGFLSNYPEITQNTSCRSLKLEDNATLTVNPGKKLTITGK